MKIHALKGEVSQPGLSLLTVQELSEVEGKRPSWEEHTAYLSNSYVLPPCLIRMGCSLENPTSRHFEDPHPLSRITLDPTAGDFCGHRFLRPQCELLCLPPQWLQLLLPRHRHPMLPLAKSNLSVESACPHQSGPHSCSVVSVVVFSGLR